MIRVSSVANGYIMERMDGEALPGLSMVFEASEEMVDGGLEAFRNMALALRDLVGPGEEPWKERGQVAIEVVPGHEYEGGFECPFCGKATKEEEE